MLEKTDDQTGKDVKSWDAEQLKTAILVVPLAGTVAAITYDVGYFVGADLYYFDVFSLQEHILSALIILPTSLIVVTTFMVALALPLAIISWFLPRHLKGPIVVLALALAVLVLSDLAHDTGKRFASAYVGSDLPLHILNDETEGRIIRTGARGVLFVTKGNKQIVLFKWDGIKSIKSIKMTEEYRYKIRSEYIAKLKLREIMAEFYLPSWLADWVLDQVKGGLGSTLLGG